MIGHEGHPEVEGTMGQVDKDDKIFLVQNQAEVDSLELKNTEKISYVTQTTLSIDETKVIIKKLKEKYPNITGPNKDDICYATQNRQDAVKSLVKDKELIIVVGSSNSSNSTRLAELAKQEGVESVLVGNIENFDLSILLNKKRIGITAGASAPEILVKNLIKKIKHDYDVLVDEMSGIEENIIFKLPNI
jgi:4-hydroxy-3-methylbut-2-enyl diphosphate reductase